MTQVTQKDIADKLRLSRVTVTKALKDHPDIAAETIAKVKKAAEEMGYTPNFIARSLSSKRTHVIGVIVPKIAHSFFASAIEAIYDSAKKNGFETIPMISFEESDRDVNNIETLLSMRVDGLLVDISQDTVSTEIYHRIREKKVPLVFFDRYLPEGGFTCVTVNDKEAAFEAVEFMIRQGYKRIFHFAGFPNISIGRDRCAGYSEALRSNKIPARKDWIIVGGLTQQSGYEHFLGLVESGKELPEAIFTVNDSVAHGIYQAAAKTGIRIPQDIGIVGFGDLEHSQLMRPPLTSVSMPIEQIAVKAVELLVEKILKPHEAEARHIVLPAVLMIRESLMLKST